MAKKTVPADKKASSKPKSNKKAKEVVAIAGAPTVKVALGDDLIRERAYGIWIAEGRPHGREHAHWQRARNELLTAEYA